MEERAVALVLMPGRDPRAAGEQRLDDGLAVDRERKCTAYARVGQLRMRLVVDQYADVEHRPPAHLAARHRLDLLELLDRDLGRDVDLAGLQTVETTGDFGHHAKHDLLGGGSAAKMRVVRDEDDAFVAAQLFDAIGTGADRIRLPRLERHGLHPAAPADDLAAPFREPLLDQRIDDPCRHPNGAGTDRLEALEAAEKRAALRPAEGLFTRHALGAEREGDVLRGQHVAVMKSHAFSEHEFEHRGRTAHPALSEGRHQLQIARVGDTDQSIEHVVGDAEVAVGDLAQWLQRRRDALHGDHDARSRHLRGGGIRGS